MKASLVSCLIILALVVGCSDDYFSETDVHGIWANENVVAAAGIPSDEDRIFRLQYNFKTDNTLEILKMVLDIESRAVVGYIDRVIANYAVSENKILSSNVEYFSMRADTGLAYTQLSDLVKVQGSGDVAREFTIQDGSILTIIAPPCPPNASCIGDIVLIKATGDQ